VINDRVIGRSEEDLMQDLLTKANELVAIFAASYRTAKH
jgi:hypothetical protein